LVVVDVIALIVVVEVVALIDRPESETDAADRRDVLGIRGVVLDLLEQPRDVDVERLRGAEPMRVPDLVHDAFATQDLARVRHEQVQDVELASGELDLLAILRDRSRRPGLAGARRSRSGRRVRERGHGAGSPVCAR
jgi:hypothetical protein